MPVYIDRIEELSVEDRRALLNRAGTLPKELLPAVREIVRNVRERRDAALHEYGARFDGVSLESFEVSPEEFGDALEAVGPAVVSALQVAIENIRRFHEAQLQPQPVVETLPGVRVWREWRPIERVGVYVPGGRAVYPSSVLMNAVPARIAGVSEVIMCTPPDRTGLVPAATLVAASVAGMTRCFKLGGAQAVAAMAYGTESVPPVLKICGAGNPYVTAAKLLVSNDVAIDMPAGPSEIMVIADGTADAAMLASDLLAQAEHGPDSAAVLVTPSAELAEEVAREVARQLDSLPLGDRAR
ncbi:MAG: histidinol dehydrogenase, partial [Chloroflexota bacterium]|nr:histidinol dehydrogenase [Chloroflexota bacterium]